MNKPELRLRRETDGLRVEVWSAMVRMYESPPVRNLQELAAVLSSTDMPYAEFRNLGTLMGALCEVMSQAPPAVSQSRVVAAAASDTAASTESRSASSATEVPAARTGS